ncbi:hypothetical protein niasHS_006891 [Heterodera schachtii]|uniref:Ig-like domain-containing protein n=1 Tax=Heterodera schachtii TaxID=97005 RepID=A0ABD2JG21_HETSC
MSLFCSSFLLLLLITQICGDRLPLSFSECIRLERWPTDGHDGATSAAKVISVREGQPAYLHCAQPKPKGQRRKELKVAWTRLRDDALLAVGTSTFTLDPRFQVSKPRRKNESDWVLILRRPSPTDQGCYLCEMNTEPTSSIVPVYLKVSIDRNEVRREESEGTADEMRKFITLLQTNIEGDSLLLNCTVKGEEEKAGELPTEVKWTKDGVPIDFYGSEKYSSERHLSNNGASVLFSLRIRTAAPEDSGIYACDGLRLVRSAQTINLVPPLASSAFLRLYLSRLAIFSNLFIIYPHFCLLIP